MTNYVTPQSGEIKKSESLSNTAKLLRAYMKATGIACAKTLSAELEINLRTIHRLKLDIATSATDGTATSATSATDGDTGTATFATGGTDQSSDKKVSPTPPSKNTSLISLTVGQEPRATDREDGFAEVKQAFNGSTERMLQTVMAGMGPLANRNDAAQWLKTLLDVNDQHAVAQAFQMLETARIKGDIIADPLRWWGKTASTLKGKAPPVESPNAVRIRTLTADAKRFMKPAPGSSRMPEAFDA